MDGIPIVRSIFEHCVDRRVNWLSNAYLNEDRENTFLNEDREVKNELIMYLMYYSNKAK